MSNHKTLCNNLIKILQMLNFEKFFAHAQLLSFPPQNLSVAFQMQFRIHKMVHINFKEQRTLKTPVA